MEVRSLSPPSTTTVEAKNGAMRWQIKRMSCKVTYAVQKQLSCSQHQVTVVVVTDPFSGAIET